MSKIIKLLLICVLAFFILDGLMLSRSSNAQDTKPLKNGLKTIIREDHRNPIVVFSAFIDVGAASEGKYFGSGISHLIEHMLFKGTQKYPPGAIADILHKYGGKIDGFTSYDYTGFRITILKEHRAIALDILKEMLSSPSFDAKELEKEKAVIEREMALNRDDPGRRVSRLTFSNAFTRHPYKVPVIGYKQSFRRLSRNDLLEFFKSNYIPEKTIIAVIGDIERDTMFSEIEKLFGETPRGRGASLAVPQEPQQTAQRRVEEKSDTSGAYLNIAFHSTSLLDRDLYAMDLLSFILGQGESSILNQEIRINKGLALSVSAYNYTPKDPGLFIISSVLKEENLKRAMDEIMKEVDVIKEKGVTDKDLLKAKNNFITGYLYQKETIGSQANDFALGQLLAGNPSFFKQYTERIKSVTLDDIRSVARKYLTKESMTVAALSRSGNALGFGFETVAQKQERKIKKITLKNKLPVLISENPSLPILSIFLLLEGGVRLETEENNGISKIVSLMFTDGTGSMSRQEIAQLYESKAMSFNAYSGNSSLGISITCLKEYTEDAMMLLSSLCSLSLFPENELERERKELEASIDMQDDQIFNQGHRLLKELLFKTHPYRFQIIGTRDSIGKTQRNDVLEFYEDIFSSDNMVLGICGDCSIEEIKALIEKYFSGIPLKKKDLVFPEKERPMTKIRESLIATDKEQSLVLIGFHGIDVYDKDRYSVEIMMDMLSRESGVLFKSIREKQGLSYATGAFQVLGTDPGYIAAYALTSKKDVDKVKFMMFNEIGSFVKNDIPDEELKRSKNHLKAMRQLAMQTNSSFIFTSCLDELYGLGYNAYKDYNIKIDSVSKEDVERTAKRLLTLDKCAVVILKSQDDLD
ncbi:M16 family metallopeptidase [Candidatus Omnitrophota bacterium]